ncbi:MAG: glycosyl hydrolase [Ferruginibacter sp.]
MNTRVIIIALLLLAAGKLFAQPAVHYRLTDAAATQETKALYYNLGQLANEHILFGHQHATEYGHGWSGDENRSDVKSVTGSHPALIGVDFSNLSGRPENEIAYTKTALKKNIEATYNRGGITTVSWHFNNPASAGGFYWVDTVSKPSVKLIIPGGAYHDQYKAILQTIASLALSLKGNDGKTVPVIFRPYHEFDGDWFWWGKAHCTAEEFKTLWRFTVGYLRDSLQVHNFIYAFSPDNRFATEEKFLERYPGDEWVDMLGMDNYGDFGRDGHYDLEAGYQKLKIISELAQKKNKLVAFTETGLESIPEADWWTEKLLKTLQRSNLKLCYVLVWRNDTKSPTHYYAPFPGQVSEKDFIKFCNDPYTLLENDLRNVYRLP